MGASFLDLNILLDKVQAGKWAAISRNKAEFIADADTPEELLKLANDWGEPDPIVVRVPKTSPSLLRDTSPALDAPPYDIIAALWRSGDVVPFLGAGASLIRPAEAPPWHADSSFLPTATELAEYLAGKNYPSKLPHERDLAKVSSFYCIPGGGKGLRLKLRAALGPNYSDKTPRKFAPGKIHEYLSTHSQPMLIVTTNYDTLIEDSFRKENVAFDVLVYSVSSSSPLLWGEGGKDPVFELDIASKLKFQRPLIFKMHGSVAMEPQNDNFVISEEHYLDFVARMAAATAIPTAVLNYLKTKSLLFLGYSLRDWNLRLVLHNLRTVLPGSGGRRDDQDDRIPSWAIQDRPSTVETALWGMRDVLIYGDKLDNFAKQMGAQK